MALNWVEKCIQNPSRVPGCAQDAPRLRRMLVSDIAGPRIERRRGVAHDDHQGDA